MIRFDEPVSLLVSSARQIFPDLSTKVVLVDGLAKAEGAWGMTWWPDESGARHPLWEDGISALIQIDGAAAYYAMPDILAHELAHAVAGPDDGHGEHFADAYRRIHTAFCSAHGAEPTAEHLAELDELINSARTGQPNGTEPMLSDGPLAEIAAERRRQIEAEGWSPAHDDQHAGAMAMAGACYAILGAGFGNTAADIARQLWPWDAAAYKPKDPRRNLVRAGALLVAELDRLDRDAGGFTQETWTAEVVDYVKGLSDDWTDAKARSYADSLFHNNCVARTGRWPDPIEAVEEDRQDWTE